MNKTDTALEAILNLAIEGAPPEQATAVIEKLKSECADPAYEGQWPWVRDDLRERVIAGASLYGISATAPHARGGADIFQHKNVSEFLERVSDMLKP